MNLFLSLLVFQQFFFFLDFIQFKQKFFYNFLSYVFYWILKLGFKISSQKIHRKVFFFFLLKAQKKALVEGPKLSAVYQYRNLRLHVCSSSVQLYWCKYPHTFESFSGLLNAKFSLHMCFKQTEPKVCHSPKVEDGVKN